MSVEECGCRRDCGRCVEVRQGEAGWGVRARGRTVRSGKGVGRCGWVWQGKPSVFLGSGLPVKQTL